MALYDYRCRRCGTEFETQHGMQETPVVACPRCGVKDTQKIITGFPVTWLRWGMPTSADDGSHSQVLHAARAGKTTPLGQKSIRISGRDLERFNNRHEKENEGA